MWRPSKVSQLNLRPLDSSGHPGVNLHAFKVNCHVYENCVHMSKNARGEVLHIYSIFAHRE